jgi:hypothetical protein
MFFQVQYALRDVDLGEGETVELSEDSPSLTTLEIRRPPPAEDPRVTGTDCVGTVRTQEVVTEKVRSQFEITVDPRPAVVQIGKRVGDRMHDYLLRAVCLLRWRRATTGHHNPIRNTQLLHWSDDAADALQDGKGICRIEACEAVAGKQRPLDLLLPVLPAAPSPGRGQKRFDLCLFELPDRLGRLGIGYKARYPESHARSEVKHGCVNQSQARASQPEPVWRYVRPPI